MRFATENEMLVYLLRRYRDELEMHLIYSEMGIWRREPSTVDMDARVRLAFAQANAAIAAVGRLGPRTVACSRGHPYIKA